MSSKDQTPAGASGEQRPAPQPPMDQRGILTEVVVPIVASGAAGASNAVVSNYLKKDKEK
jgi:hypothetical protein